MSIEIFKDKETEKREAEEQKKVEAEAGRKREAELDRRIAYLNMAVQICVARQKPTIDAIFAMAEEIKDKAES